MDADVFADLSRHVDREFYRHHYPDIARAGLDPVPHWHRAGWVERRRPNVWFDTGFYLDTYADIASARIDPLLHYIRHGRAEGRLAQPPRAARLAALQAARPAASHQAGYDAPDDAPILDAGELASLLLRAMAPHAFAPHAFAPRAFAGSGSPVGLLVAASHDRYIDVTGGIQLVLADEQRACAASGTTHLHLAPAVARLALADGTEPACLLQATIDGTFRGLVSAAAATAAIETVARAMPDRPRRLAIHSLLGHRTDTLAALAGACGPDAVFWLHDHSSLCEGFNLLRNDLDACHAPPPESMACRICVHGEGRALHRARIRALFDTVPFHVLAPSRVALDLWLARADLPFATASVAEPARLVPTGAEPRDAPATDPASPLRTAFLGYPLAHKGWPLFLDLVTALSLAEPGEPPCALHHLAVPEALRPMDRVATIPVQVGPAARQAAVEAIAAHAIEAVIVASPWPETFNFVAHEAAAAGAAVLTLADAGNVPAMVRRHGAGYVFETGAALLEFLLSGRAREEIRARKRPAPARLVPGRGSLARLEALLAEPPA